MLTGLGVTLYYLLGVKFFGMQKWFGISDISAGVFGLAAGFVVIIGVSLISRAPDQATRALIESVRFPGQQPGKPGDRA